jgi:hypothetical protein
MDEDAKKLVELSERLLSNSRVSGVRSIEENRHLIELIDQSIKLLREVNLHLWEEQNDPRAEKNPGAQSITRDSKGPDKRDQ